jgi:hypothetical protein
MASYQAPVRPWWRQQYLLVRRRTKCRAGACTDFVIPRNCSADRRAIREGERVARTQGTNTEFPRPANARKKTTGRKAAVLVVDCVERSRIVEATSFLRPAWRLFSCLLKFGLQATRIAPRRQRPGLVGVGDLRECQGREHEGLRRHVNPPPVVNGETSGPGPWPLGAELLPAPGGE